MFGSSIESAAIKFLVSLLVRSTIITPGLFHSSVRSSVQQCLTRNVSLFNCVAMSLIKQDYSMNHASYLRKKWGDVIFLLPPQFSGVFFPKFSNTMNSEPYVNELITIKESLKTFTMIISELLELKQGRSSSESESGSLKSKLDFDFLVGRLKVKTKWGIPSDDSDAESSEEYSVDEDT